LNSVKIKPRRKRAYHHGDLKRQLIAAAEELILERGVDGFTLREAARRAGVSPAAPAHHFGDAEGLLAEVAYLGFKEFGDALEAADKQGSDDPHDRLYRQGLAYVHFALGNPARFELMFRHSKVDFSKHPALAEAGDRAFRILEDAIRAATGTRTGAPLSPDASGYLMAIWSIVHGFAHLALGGEFDGPALQGRGGKGAILTTFLPLALKHLPRPDPNAEKRVGAMTRQKPRRPRP
jgi:AcrR family transcriptional regulator